MGGGVQLLESQFVRETELLEKEVEKDVAALLALFDYLGLASPVLYGRDWGVMRASKFKIMRSN